MKFKKNTLILIFLFTFLIAVLMSLEEFFEGELSAEGALEEVVVYLMILGTLLLTIVTPAYRVVKRFNQNLPWEAKGIKRFFYELGMILGLSGLLGFVFGNIIHHFIEHELPTLTVLMRTTLFLFIITTLIVCIIEFLLLTEDRDRLRALSERLEKENVITLYNALKNQVNPHFLFNHLSVLSSLIYYDVKKAEHFIKAFSNIYRYVLELKEEALISVKEEMSFLESWIYLQKIRFGENLIVQEDVSTQDLELSLPPLSLQIVFENAVKHNVISKKYPLKIQLLREGNYLVIKNKLQKRKEEPQSTGVGIKNLKERYRLLGEQQPSFGVQGNFFVARLPLI